MKPMYLSKTVIVNVLTLVLMFLQSEQLVSIIPERAMKYVVTAVAIVNLALRFMTNTGVSISGK